MRADGHSIREKVTHILYQDCEQQKRDVNVCVILYIVGNAILCIYIYHWSCTYLPYSTTLTLFYCLNIYIHIHIYMYVRV